MNRALSVLLSVVLWSALSVNAAHGQEKKTLWEGLVHLGDSPKAFPKATYAGLTFQVPCKLVTSKAAKLTVTAADIQTQAGLGHYVEVLAHFESQPDKAPAKEVVVETFRIKDKSDFDDEYTFEINPRKNLGGKMPAYYSVRIKVDTYVAFGLWDDFLIKRIEMEQ